jgi:Ca2+-binding RTX toxin-like protein
MTITISVNSSAGVNVNYGASNYLDTVNDNFNSMTGQFGFFNNSFVNASQYGLATNDGADADTLIDDGNAFIAGGNMTYNLATNTLSGSIDTLTFGDGLNGVTSVSPGTTTTSMSIGTGAFTISSLGITGTTQTDNTHNILYNLMNGNEGALETYLASQAVIFQGNNGNDAFQGGSQADSITGGGGDDILAGGGGADSLSGGTGHDIFVFSAVSDSTTTTFDTIDTFNASGLSSDIIDVSALGLTGGWAGSTATARSIWYDAGAGKFFADTTGDTTADFAIKVNAVSGTLDASDFDFVV